MVVRIDPKRGPGGVDAWRSNARGGELEVAAMMADLDESMKGNPMIPHAVRGKVLNETKGAPETSIGIRWKDPDGEEHSAEAQRHVIEGKRFQVGNLPSLLVQYDERVFEHRIGKKWAMFISTYSWAMWSCALGKACSDSCPKRSMV